MSSIWYFLRRPRVTLLFAIIPLAVLLLQFFIPQAPPGNIASETWTAGLPVWLQPWEDLLFSLGFFNIWRSVWFWIPLALLLLSCLVSLADYARPSWLRINETPAGLDWQHPLTQRVEQSVRLPAAPDTLLDELRDNLTRRGFVVDRQLEENGRIISAARGRWSWTGILAVYLGLTLLCLAFLVSRYTLETEWLTLQPFNTYPSRLLAGTVEVDAAGADRQSSPAHVGKLSYVKTGAEANQSLPWRLYQPLFVERAIVLPTAVEPVLTIEARDSTGALQRLLPTRPDLSVAARLNLPLDTPDEPLYFSLRSSALIFQILPAAVLNDNRFNLQVVRRNETEPAANETLSVGEAFEIDDLVVDVSLNHKVSLLVWRDPALPIYGLSFGLIVAGALLILWRPAWQVWLLPEVKGRGGQLYGVAETMRSNQKASEFLAKLLTPEDSDGDSQIETEKKEEKQEKENDA